MGRTGEGGKQNTSGGKREVGSEIEEEITRNIQSVQYQEQLNNSGQVMKELLAGRGFGQSKTQNRCFFPPY